jgi:hypothetical protein
MKVENIKTDKDADEFLLSHYFGKDGNKIIIGDCNDASLGFFQPEEVKKYLDSLDWSKWIRKDFNSDKRLDLVYCGCIGNAFKVIVFISQKGNGYSVTELASSSEYNNPHYIKLIKDKGLLVVEKYNPDKQYWDTTITYRQMITADTLKYWDGNFVDWDTKESQNKIEQIEISHRVALAKNVRERKLIITEGGLMRFEKKGNISDTAYKLGVFIYEKERHDSVTNFLKLLNALPFAKFDSIYNAPYFDGFTWNMVVKFKSGETKEIYDHMGVAPHSIRLLYDYAMRRFNDNDWKLIEIKEKW